MRRTVVELTDAREEDSIKSRATVKVERFNAYVLQHEDRLLEDMQVSSCSYSSIVPTFADLKSI